MAATLLFRIVTPEGEIFKADAEYVSLPSSQGELGIYPNHIPLLATTEAGTVTVRKPGGEEIHFAIGRGAVELNGDHVNMVADGAVNSDLIDEAAAEAAIKRAEEAMSEKLSHEEVATLEANIARATAQLHLKRRKR